MKTFRKSSLITSVALLLVAIVALGGATFAWFTSDPNASADGLSLKASAANGLVVLSATEKAANGAFATSTDLNYGATDPFVLTATSYNLTGDALGSDYATTAANVDNYAADTAATVSAGAGGYTENIYARLSGAVADGYIAKVYLDKVEISAANAANDMINAVKVAVTYTDNSADTTTLLGVFSLDGGDNNYLTNTGTYSTVLSTAEYDFAQAAAALNIEAGEIDNSGNDYFTVTVYLDGEDGECYSNNAYLDTLIDDIDLGFKVVEEAVTTEG